MAKINLDEILCEKLKADADACLYCGDLDADSVDFGGRCSLMPLYGYSNDHKLSTVLNRRRNDNDGAR